MPWVDAQTGEPAPTDVQQALGAPDGQPEKPSTGEALATGAAQGLTLGNAGRMAGALSIMGGQEENPEPQDYDALKATSDATRAAYDARAAQAKQAHPLAYGGAKLAGGLLPASVAVGALGPLAGGAAVGGIEGASESAAPDAAGMAKDTAIGAGAGIAGGALGSKLGSKVVGGGAEKLGLALDYLGRKATGAKNLAAGVMFGQGEPLAAAGIAAVPPLARAAGKGLQLAGKGLQSQLGASAAGTLGRVAGPQLASGGAPDFAPGISHVRQLAPNFAQHPALAPFANLLTKSLAQGQEAFDANVFTLAQTNPKFQAALKELNEAPQKEGP